MFSSFKVNDARGIFFVIILHMLCIHVDADYKYTGQLGSL